MYLNEMGDTQESIGNENAAENVSLDSSNGSAYGSSRKKRFQKEPWHKVCPNLLEFFTISYFDVEGNRLYSSGHPQYRCIECGTTMKGWDDRILKHINNCQKISDEGDSLDCIRTKLTLKNGRLAMGSRRQKCWELMMKLIAKYAIPFKFLEDSLFIELLEQRPGDWRTPTIEHARSVLLPTLGLKARLNLKKLFTEQRPHSIAIQLDHWTELAKANWLGLTATMSNGRCELISLVDVSASGQASSTTLNILLHKLQPYEPDAINVIMSDASSACLLACRLFTENENYKHVYSMRCFAHFLNKIIEKIKDHETLSKLLADLSLVTNTVLRSSYMRSQIQLLDCLMPQKITPTRWYSCVDSIRTGIDTIRKLRTYFDSNEDRMSELRRSNPTFLNILHDEEYLSRLEKLLPILEPLNYCIAIAERSDGTLGEAFRCLLEYLRSLFKCDLRKDEYARIALCAVTEFLSTKHLLTDHRDLCLAAMVLDRRYNANYLTIEGLVRVSSCFYKIAEKTNFDTSVVNESLMTFIDQSGEFQVLAPPTMRPKQWWNLRGTSEFVKLARRIVSCPSSTANTERMFSRLKVGQGLFKTSFDIRTLENLTRLSLSCRSEKDMETIEMDLDKASIAFYQKQGEPPNEEPTFISWSVDESEMRYHYDDVDNFTETEFNNLKSICQLINFGIVNECIGRECDSQRREHGDLANEFRNRLMTRAKLGDISNLPSQPGTILTSIVNLADGTTDIQE